MPVWEEGSSFKSGSLATSVSSPGNSSEEMASLSLQDSRRSVMESPQKAVISFCIEYGGKMKPDISSKDQQKRE